MPLRRPGRRAAAAVLGAALLMTAAAGCSRPGTVDAELHKTAPAPSDTLPAGTCPTRDDDLPNAIDWVDFVHVAGRMYVRDGALASVGTAGVGAPVGTVRCTFSEMTTNPWQVARDGDASFLQPGTALRAVTGQPVEQVVAADAGGGSWAVYRVEGGAPPAVANT